MGFGWCFVGFLVFSKVFYGFWMFSGYFFFRLF